MLLWEKPVQYGKRLKVQGDSMDNDVAILVTSFDGYSDLWNNFFKIFSIYWKDCNIKIYLSTNNLDYKNDMFDVDVLKTGNETNWKERMLKILDNISERYIIIFLEDYFLGKKVNNFDIWEIIEFMKNNNILMYRLANYPKQNPKKGNVWNGKAAEIYKDKRYGVNFQCSIWNKKHLRKLIRLMNGVTCWDFEYMFLNKALNARHEIYTYYLADVRNLLNVQNGVLHGKWIPATRRFYEKEKIELDYGTRDFMNTKAVIKRNIYIVGRKIVPDSFNYKVKKILKKFGMKFQSEI